MAASSQKSRGRLNQNLRRTLRCGLALSLALALPLGLAAALGGCTTVGYYWQAAHGEYTLLAARQPISRLLASPGTAPKLKARLELARRARAFASNHLQLPRNKSYTTYVALHRAYVVWNVYATPTFSVQPINHCFPVAGCVAYQGYFSKADAEAAAQRWRTRGDDAAVFGAPAYSTLGWFSDPLLSTMMRWNNAQLVGDIFHELAHQQFYVKGDTRFNESWATFVQREGLAQWRMAQALPPLDGTVRNRARAFTQLILSTRKKLAAVYANKLPADMLRARKADVFAGMRRRYRQLRKAKWHGYSGYDGFFKQPLNNARLVPFGLYHQWVLGFRLLFQRSGGNWKRFQAAVAKLGAQPKAQRDAAIKHLTQRANASAKTSAS